MKPPGVSGLPLEALVDEAGPERHPGVRGPEDIGARQPLFPVGLVAHHVPGGLVQPDERDCQVPLGQLEPPEDAVRELLVEGDPVAPRLGQVGVVEELVEAGHLGRLDRLVGDQGPLEHPEDGRAHRRPRERVPGDPNLGVDLVLVQIAIQVVEAGSQGDGRVLEELQIAVRVDIEVPVALRLGRLDHARIRERDSRLEVGIDVEVSDAASQVEGYRAEQMLELAAVGGSGEPELGERLWDEHGRGLIGVGVLVREVPDEDGVRRERVPAADAEVVPLYLVPHRRIEVLLEELLPEIAELRLPVTVLELEACLGRQLDLEEGVDEQVLLVGVRPEAVGREVALSRY